MATEHDHFAAERRRVKEAFEFFDREGRGLLVKEEVGTIMRYLGAFPSEDALVNEILPQVLLFVRVPL
jgi:calmodulin